MKIRNFVLILGLLLPGTGARACDGEYFAAALLAPELLPSPPKERSALWQDQVAKVLRAQRNLPAETRVAMRDEQHLHLESLAVLLGPGFERKRLPLTFGVLDRVLGDAGCVNDAAKRYWGTRRPYVADPRVKLLVDPVGNNAYPSGHTSGSRVLAEVLGLIAPEKLAALRARADEIAWHRVEAGVHYPVDLEGGRIEAMQVVGALATSAKFQQDLAAAKAEMAARAAKKK